MVAVEVEVLLVETVVGEVVVVCVNEVVVLDDMVRVDAVDLLEVELGESHAPHNTGQLTACMGNRSHKIMEDAGHNAALSSRPLHLAFVAVVVVDADVDVDFEVDVDVEVELAHVPQSTGQLSANTGAISHEPAEIIPKETTRSQLAGSALPLHVVCRRILPEGPAVARWVAARTIVK